MTAVLLTSSPARVVVRALPIVLAGAVACGRAVEPPRIDPQLAAYIDGIRAVDNHAHVFAPDVADDTGYDALRCEPLPATPGLLPPAVVRFGPDTQAAWQALYGQTPATAEEAAQKLPALHAALRK